MGGGVIEDHAPAVQVPQAAAPWPVQFQQTSIRLSQVAGDPVKSHAIISSDQRVMAEDTPGNQYAVNFWLNNGKETPVKIQFLLRQGRNPSVCATRCHCSTRQHVLVSKMDHM